MSALMTLLALTLTFSWDPPANVEQIKQLPACQATDAQCGYRLYITELDSVSFGNGRFNIPGGLDATQYTLTTQNVPDLAPGAWKIQLRTVLNNEGCHEPGPACSAASETLEVNLPEEIEVHLGPPTSMTVNEITNLINQIYNQ